MSFSHISLKKRCIPRSEKTFSPTSEPQTASHSFFLLFLNKADTVPRLPCLSLIYCIVLLRSWRECDRLRQSAILKSKWYPSGAPCEALIDPLSRCGRLCLERWAEETQTRPERWRQTKSGPKWQSDAPLLRVKAPFERESFWLDNVLGVFFSQETWNKTHIHPAAKAAELWSCCN